jgi:hypothetical protein
MNALGATFKPGVLLPFALVSHDAFARLLTFWSKRFNLFRFFRVTIPTVIHFTFSIAFLL